MSPAEKEFRERLEIEKSKGLKLWSLTLAEGSNATVEEIMQEANSIDRAIEQGLYTPIPESL